MVAKDQLNKQNLDISYFSYFMDRESAEKYIAVTYTFNVCFFNDNNNYKISI